MVNCFQNRILNDEKLTGYILDGSALSADTTRHLEQCMDCLQQLTQYQQIHTALLSQLYRRYCPSSTRLSNYCTRLLSVDETIRISAHLRHCPLCAHELEEIRQIILEPDKIIR